MPDDDSDDTDERDEERNEPSCLAFEDVWKHANDDARLGSQPIEK